MQAVNENPAQANPCTNFQSPIHPTEQCPMAPSVKDLMSEYANTVGQYKPPQPNAPYGNTYNSNWRNHPNLSWKPTPPAYVPPGAKPQFGSQSQPQPPPSSSPVEQAILNLSKVVGSFVEAQRIDTVESTLNKRIDGLESNLNQKLITCSTQSPRSTSCWRYRKEEGSLPKQCQTPRESMRWGHPVIQEWMR